MLAMHAGQQQTTGQQYTQSYSQPTSSVPVYPPQPVPVQSSQHTPSVPLYPPQPVPVQSSQRTPSVPLYQPQPVPLQSSQPTPSVSVYQPQPVPLQSSQPTLSVPVYPPQPAPTQHTLRVQPPPPSQGPPQPLFCSPVEQPIPPQVAISDQTGPGHIDSKPTMSASSNFQESSGFPEIKGFRSRPTRGNFRYHGPPRGGARPRIPRSANPREWGPPPRQRDPTRSHVPGNFKPRQVHQTFDAEPQSFIAKPRQVHQTFDTEPQSFDASPKREDYQQGGAAYNPGTYTKKVETTVEAVEIQNRREADDIDHSLYSKEPVNPPDFNYDSQPKLPHQTAEQNLAMKSSSGASDADREDELLYTSSPTTSTNAPTVDSLQINSGGVAAIPGLGEPISDVSQTAPPKEESESTNTKKMLASLGKLMTELQGLKGLSSNLQLLSVPQEEKKESEQEMAKKKVAALLANESDSDGEPQVCL